jgi:hypothetical protein
MPQDLHRRVQGRVQLTDLLERPEGEVTRIGRASVQDVMVIGDAEAPPAHLHALREEAGLEQRDTRGPDGHEGGHAPLPAR